MDLGLLTEILQAFELPPIPIPDIPIPEVVLEVGVLAAVGDMSILEIPVAMFIDSMAGLTVFRVKVLFGGSRKKGRIRYMYCVDITGR